MFIQAFTMTFLAEWGDRSQIATIILGARDVRAHHKHIFIIFLTHFLQLRSNPDVQVYALVPILLLTSLAGSICGRARSCHRPRVVYMWYIQPPSMCRVFEPVLGQLQRDGSLHAFFALNNVPHLCHFSASLLCCLC